MNHSEGDAYVGVLSEGGGWWGGVTSATTLYEAYLMHKCD